MAQARNNFIKSKMNKDLDSRLVPPGEYRDALNVSVSKSEGPDVGALENILGNVLLTQFGLESSSDPAVKTIEIIGFFMDVNTNRIFVFMTNYVDTSSDRLSNFAPAAAQCLISVFNTDTNDVNTLVSGNFLNFSKCSPVYGVNLINSNLYFTDNRNQPRKINVDSAINGLAYTSEDQISLAKYYPFEPIHLTDERVVGFTTYNNGSGYATPQINVATTNTNPSGLGSGLTVDVNNVNGVTFTYINNPGNNYENGDVVNIVNSNNAGGVAAITLEVGVVSTMKDVVSEFLPGGGKCEVTSKDATAGGYFGIGKVKGLPPKNGQTVTSASINQSTKISADALIISLVPNRYQLTPTNAFNQISIGDEIITNRNPDYNPNWPGDRDYLKDKFVRFAYRFKYDDGEYSLISPFTQACFVPKQDGYFLQYTPVTAIVFGSSGTLNASPLVTDLDRTMKSTEVDFFENKINDIDLMIPPPAGLPDWNGAATAFKINSIDIIYKDDSQSTLKVVDTLEFNQIVNVVSKKIKYNYQSVKPYKTLPVAALLRVYDQTPVRAFTQEVIGNRVIYGNFVDKHTPPTSLEYNTYIGFKNSFPDGVPSTIEKNQVRKEYQNHSLKQNRNYQVGIVLSDRYGRQSDTILSTINDQVFTSLLKGSTVFNPYKEGVNEGSGIDQTLENSFSYNSYLGNDVVPSNTNLFVADYNASPNPIGDTWPGDQLKIQFNAAISSAFNSNLGTPGLYSLTNPTGWYSYKVVVKQNQVDYYNVYVPGVLNGYVSGETAGPLAANLTEPICHFVLNSDNINKIPKDTSLVGPNQNIFRTARPSFNEDSSYYQFTDTNGVKFTADPYTEEGENLLKTRDRLRDLDSGSQVNNAAVELFTRVLNRPYSVPNSATGEKSQLSGQYYPGEKSEVVSAIGTGSELGLYDPASLIGYPFNTAPVFYGFENNPFIAKMNLYSAENESEVKGFGLRGPSQDAAVYSVEMPFGQASPTLLGGTNYPPDAKGVPIVFNEDVATNSDVTEFKNRFLQVDFKTGTISGTPSSPVFSDNGIVNNVVLTNRGKDWEKATFSSIGSSVNMEAIATIEAAGDGNCQFPVRVYKREIGTAQERALRFPNARNIGTSIFSVFETNPLESKLDIYWETTTAGLISDLNATIIANDTTTPEGFSDLIFVNNTAQKTQTLNWVYLESAQLDTNLTPGNTTITGSLPGFIPTDYNGNPITMFNGGLLAPRVTLISVFDSSSTPNNITSGFELTELSLSIGSNILYYYQIKNKAYRAYLSNSQVIDDYTITLRVVAPSNNYAIDGSLVTRDVIFGTAPAA